MNSLDKFKQAIQGMSMNFGNAAKSVGKSVVNSLPPVQAYNAVKQIATPQYRQQIQQIPQQLIQSKPAQYFNPTSNQGNNFWSSKPAQSFSNMQRGIQIAAPKVQQLGQSIMEKTTPDFNIRTPQQFGQAVIKAPFQFAGQFVGGTLQDLGQVAGMSANPERFRSLPNITAKSFIDPSNPSKASVGLSALSLIPMGSSVKSIQADAKAFKTMLPEIRAVGKMLGNMDEIPFLSPRQVEAAEEIVSKIRGTEFVKKILKTSKNPVDYYNNIRRTLAYAEDIVNNPQAAFGLSTKAVDTSKFRQPTKGVESGLYNVKVYRHSDSTDIVGKQYFTTDPSLFKAKGKNTIEADITLKNPFKETERGSLLSRQKIEELSKQGYDGWINSTGLVVVPFEKESVVVNKINNITQPSVTKGVESMPVKAQNLPEVKPNQVLQTTPNQLPLQETQSVVSQVSSPDYSTKVNIGSTSKYNVGKIKGNEKVVKEAVDQVKPSFEKVAGGPIKHEEILKQAQEFSNKTIKDIGRQTTEELGAAQLRLRQNIAAMADSGEITPELLDAMKTDALFARSNAQLLGQRNIDANPQTPYGKNLIKYVEAANKVADDIDAVYEAAKGVDFNNKEAASAFYRQFVKPSVGDWLDRVRYSSMLSSPNTTINNISSNLQGTGILAPIEKVISGGIDSIVSGLTGSQRRHFAGEGTEYLKGYWSNVKPALQNFANAMKGGSDASEMFDVPLTQQGTAMRGVENTLAFFPRLQQAFDELFSTMTKGGLEKANIYRKIKGGVLQSADEIGLEAKRRLFNQPFGSDQSYLLNMIEYIPSKIMEATHSKNPWIKYTSKFIFPFVRIPANVFKAGIEYSPLGIATLPGANNKVEQASKALMGASVATGAWMLANSDRLTFGMPTSEKQRDAFTASGLQPYSVKIGNKWVSYTKFHPIIGFNFALASAVKEELDKKTISDDQLDTVLGVVSKWLTYFANQSYVKQMGDFLDLSKGNEGAVGRAIGNYPSQLIPFRAFAGWLARAFDPYERKIDPDGSKLDKALQSIMMSIPGLRNQLMTRKDSMGNPVKQQNRFLNLVSPGKVTSEIPEQKAIFDSLVAKSTQTAKDTAIKNELKKKGTDEVKELGKGRYAWFDKEKGEVVTVDISEPIIEPRYTGVDTIDKKLKTAYKADISRRENDIVKLLKVKKISLDEATKLIDDLDVKYSKTLKGKKPKKITLKVSSYKAPKITIKKRSSAKLPTIKIKKPKKTKIVRRYTIK